MNYVYKWRDDEGVKFKEMSFSEMYDLANKNENILFVCYCKVN